MEGMLEVWSGELTLQDIYLRQVVHVVDLQWRVLFYTWRGERPWSLGLFFFLFRNWLAFNLHNIHGAAGWTCKSTSLWVLGQLLLQIHFSLIDFTGLPPLSLNFTFFERESMSIPLVKLLLEHLHLGNQMLLFSHQFTVSVVAQINLVWMCLVQLRVHWLF